jgi:hypothetical protein
MIKRTIMQTTFKQKTKLFSLALIGTVLLFASSCKKDDAPAPTPAPAAKLAEYKDGEDFIRFQYNADGTVRKATVKNEVNTSGDVVDFTVTYTNKKITEINSTSGEKIVPVYENNVLTRADIFMGGERTGYTNYEFQGGNMKRATIYVGTDNDFVPILEFQYNYNAAGNVTEGIILVGDGTGTMDRAGHVELSYDTKTNPLYGVKDFMIFLWQGMSKNNVVVEKIYDSNMQLEDRFLYEYTYKANGLPEKADVEQGLPGDPVQTSSVGFVYQ